MRNMKINPVKYENNDEKISSLFSNDCKIAEYVSRLNTKDKLLTVGLVGCLLSIFKLNRKCKAQQLRIETLTHRVDILTMTVSLDGGKETKECNA